MFLPALFSFASVLLPFRFRFASVMQVKQQVTKPHFREVWHHESWRFRSASIMQAKVHIKRFLCPDLDTGGKRELSQADELS